MTFKQVLSYFLTGAAVLSVTATALAADVPADVQASVWYHPAVEYVLEHGLMDAAEQDAFAPDDPVTRQETAEAICRDAKRREPAQQIQPAAMTTAPAGRWDTAVMELQSFTDYDAVSPWARDSITLCLAGDLLHGNVDGSFGPQEPVTRAELAQILYHIAHW